MSDSPHGNDLRDHESLLKTVGEGSLLVPGHPTS